jgi:thioester reductase-like protein
VKYEEIAIIGVAARLPQAENVEEFWENIASGRDSVRDFPPTRLKEIEDATGRKFGEFARGGYLEQMSQFEPGYFNISEEESKYIDPQHRLLMELVEESIETTGYSPQKLSESRVGVFMASSINHYAQLMKTMPMGVANTSEAAAAGRISYTFNFSGPSLTMNTESSSTLVALHYACQSLQQGECDYAITGGSRLHVYPPDKQFVQENMMTSTHQKIMAFDAKADGIIAGEGGGVFILKRLEHAVKDKDTIWAVIKGTGINSNGNRSIGLSAPSQEALAELITQVFERSGIDPNSITCIEAHGTGTPIGDPIEIEGITKAYTKYTEKKQFIPISSVKTNVGHLGSAAAIPGIIKGIMSLKNRKIAPSLNFQKPNPLIEFENSPIYVNTELKEWETETIRRVGINSLGLTGTNAFAILEEAPPTEEINKDKEKQEGDYLFTLSAKTAESFAQQVLRLKQYLEQNKQVRLRDLSYTLNTGRRHLPWRMACQAQNNAQLKEKINQIKQPSKPTVDNDPDRFLPVPIFIYPDINRNSGMSINTFGEVPVYRKSYQELEAIAGQRQPQPGFFFQYSLSKLIESLGIEPQAVFGVGKGKIAADVIKGKKKIEEGLKAIEGYELQEESPDIDVEKLKTLVNNMLSKGYNLFITIGEGGVLGKEIFRQLKEQKGIPTIYLEMGAHCNSLNSALCQLYTHHIDINWEALYNEKEVQRLNLPTYPFNRKSYLITPPPSISKPETETSSPDIQENKESPGKPAEVSFEEILGLFKQVVSPDLDLEEDYVDNNGNSIAVMQLITLIRENYRITLNIDQFYSYPTLRELIQKIETQITEGQETDTEEIVVRQKDMEPDFELDDAEVSLEKVDPKNVLLTGSTGFLGSHLLKELIEKTDARIYCLSRGSTQEEAHHHSLNMWKYYFKEFTENLLDKRIIVVKGDITREKLGMEPKVHQEMDEVIDTVIHSAADVRHYGKYEPSEKVNTKGTQNIIRFCTSRNSKRLHHVSTKAIAEYPREAAVLKENNLDIGQVFRGRVYARSKFEAEKAVNQARTQGLKAAIYRIGDLTGRYTDGFFQKNIETNRYYNNIKALALLKKIVPSALDEITLEVSPVDVSCQAILKLLQKEGSMGRNFHIMNPDYVPLRKFCGAFKNLGYPIEEVTIETFSDFVEDQLKTKGFIKELSWISYVLTLDEYAHLPTLEFDSEFTHFVLAKTKFKWPQIQEDYIERMIQHCVDVNYITLK